MVIPQNINFRQISFKNSFLIRSCKYDDIYYESVKTYQLRMNEEKFLVEINTKSNSQ